MEYRQVGFVRFQAPGSFVGSYVKEPFVCASCNSSQEEVTEQLKGRRSSQVCFIQHVPIEQFCYQNGAGLHFRGGAYPLSAYSSEHFTCDSQATAEP